MCGISGALAPDPRADVSGIAERLSAALAHRGPDGVGLHLARGRSVALAHRRLSIVDVACGAQPMTGEDGRVWVTYNGEIYNHSVLRQQLEALGHTFRTRADTEVLVHGWEEWGPNLLQRLNGIFAFALLDERDAAAPVLWLARDAVGVKPLYVGVSGGIWWFTSELAAAREADLLDETLRPEAFDEFLVYRFVPSPGTFYPNAWKLPPGALCRLDLNALPAKPSFDMVGTAVAPSATPRSRGEWEDALRDGLRAAVERQLMSDVPVGSLLSGGVDSTVVTRFMRDALPEPPMTFGIGFAGEPGGGELANARRAAQALAVPLTEVSVRDDEYQAAWPVHAGRLGEPIANSGVLLVGMLCAEVRKTHKVVLSGQGADEPLGGYPRHAGERYYSLARRLGPLLRRLPEGLASSDRVRRVQRLAAEREEARRFAEILAVFSPKEAVALTRHRIEPDQLVDPVRRALPPDHDGDSLNRLLRADARLSLADDLLTVADHMSMAESVELRVPFLDLEYFALLERMPSRYKVSPVGGRKWLYRRAVAGLLPDAVRRDLTGVRSRLGRKLGFATPIDRWFRDWLHGGAEAYLLGPSARSTAFLQADTVRELLTAVRDRGAPRTRQLLALYVLEAWLRGAMK